MEISRSGLQPVASTLLPKGNPKALETTDFIDRLMGHGNFNSAAYSLYRLENPNDSRFDGGSGTYGEPVTRWLNNLVERPRTAPLIPLQSGTLTPQDIFNVIERGEHLYRDDHSSYSQNDLNRLTSEIVFGLNGNDQTFSFNTSRKYYSRHQYSSNEYYFHFHAIDLLHKLARIFPEHKNRLKQLAYEKQILLCAAVEASREFPGYNVEDVYDMSLKVLSAAVGEPVEAIEQRHGGDKLLGELNDINLHFTKLRDVHAKREDTNRQFTTVA